MDLLDTVIVVTGAGQGLGRAVSLRLATMGPRLAIVDYDDATLQQTFDQMNLPPNIATKYVCDTREASQVTATVGNIIEATLAVDIVINIAETWPEDPAKKTKSALQNESLENAQFIEALLPHLQKKNKGQIVNVISSAKTDPTLTLKKAVEGTEVIVSDFFLEGFENDAPVEDLVDSLLFMITRPAGEYVDTLTVVKKSR